MILLQHLSVRALKQLHDVEFWFPRRGSILIEGQNEAGKSTLLEAIYFALYGASLVGEETRATLEDLMPHNGVPAQLELTLTTGEVTLEIRRKLLPKITTRRVIHEARLRVWHDSMPLEEINGPQAVNLRILQEVNGLDGDALRNSCFMEQRGLDRVERLARDQRDTSVAKLIGIERLRHVEKELRDSGNEQKRLLSQLSMEYEIATLRQAATGAEISAARAAEQVRAARVRLLLEERDSRNTGREARKEQIAILNIERHSLTNRILTSTRLQALQTELTGATSQLQEASEAEPLCAEILVLLQTLQDIEQEALPTISRRLEALQALDGELAAIEATRTAITTEENAVAAEAVVTQARVALDLAEHAYAEAREASLRATLRGTLMRWLDLKELQTSANSNSGRVAALKEQHIMLTMQAAQAEAAIRYSQLSAAFSAFLALLALVAGLKLPYLWVLAGILVIGLAYFQWRTQQCRRQQHHVEQEAAETAARLAGLVAEMETAQRMAGSFGELLHLEQQLHSIGIFPGLQTVRPMLATLGQDTDDTLFFQSRVEETQQMVAEQRAYLAAVQEQLEQLTHAPSARGGNGLKSIGPQGQVAMLYEVLRSHEDMVTAKSQELAIIAERNAVAAARGAAEAEQRALNVQLQAREVLTMQLHQRTVYAEQTLVGAQDALSNLQHHMRLEGMETSGQLPMQQNLSELKMLAELLADVLAQRMKEMDEQQAHVELATVEERFRALEQRGGEEAAIFIRLCEQVVEQLATGTPAGSVYHGNETLEKLASDWPLLANVDDARLDSYEEMHRTASQEAHHLRQSVSKRELSYGLQDTELEVENCAKQLAESERSCRRYELAAEMAQQVRGRIVRRILPETQAHMRALLPELTAGRYRDVQLLAEDTNNLNADLSIRLWDEVAGRYVGKNLFSAGTRDQCSLALRLAFALATLPKELGAMPGFIFLDEPLSSFDAERSQALVQILTHGAIARQFDQVLLISHSQTFNRDNFRFYVRMENGQISESNLPGAFEAKQLWPVHNALKPEVLG